MSIKLGNSAPRCVRRLRAGKPISALDRAGIETGRYEVCLTNTQLARLGNLDKVIGCGAFACAFDEGDKVVKITRDRFDVSAMEAATDAGVHHVAEVKNIFELVPGGRDLNRYKTIPVYAMEVEKLRPLTRGEKQRYSKWLRIVRGALPMRAFFREGSYIDDQRLEDNRERNCPKELKLNAACKRFVREAADTWNELSANSVKWTDMHAGNIGFAPDGTWKILDLGAEKNPMYPRGEELAAPKKTRRVK